MCRIGELICSHTLWWYTLPLAVTYHCHQRAYLQSQAVCQKCGSEEDHKCRASLVVNALCDTFQAPKAARQSNCAHCRYGADFRCRGVVLVQLYKSGRLDETKNGERLHS